MTAEFDRNAEEVLIASARYCCLCRRYRPTWIQVHHIEEQSGGGTDDLENLAPICMTCHSDVHTRRPFTRRFTAKELRSRRDELYRLVREQQLVPPMHQDRDASDIVVSRPRMELTSGDTVGLSTDAARFIQALASGGGSGHLFRSNDGWSLSIGTLTEDLTGNQHRRAKEIEAELDEMHRLRLISLSHLDAHSRVFELTAPGYTVADDLSALTS